MPNAIAITKKSPKQTDPSTTFSCITAYSHTPYLFFTLAARLLLFLNEKRCVTIYEAFQLKGLSK